MKTLYLTIAAALTFLASSLATAWAVVEYPGGDPGPAKVRETKEEITLSNNLFSLTLAKSGDPGTKPVRRPDGRGGVMSSGGQRLKFKQMNLSDGSEVFMVISNLFDVNGIEWNSSMMEVEKLRVENLKAEPKSPQLSRRVPGKAVSAVFIDNNTDGAYTVEWRMELRDGSHYLREELTVKAKKDTTLTSISPWWFVPHAHGKLVLSGDTTYGKVMTNDIIFAALETPMSTLTTKEYTSPPCTGLTRTLESSKPLRAGESWHVSAVVGLIAPQQARRSVLAYLERERPAAYHPFIHYNDRYAPRDEKNRTDETMWTQLLDTWNAELHTQRGERVDGMVLDSGWDNTNGLWSVHKGFAKGLADLSKKAAGMKTGLGVGICPTGGTGNARQQRIDAWNKKHPNDPAEGFRLTNKSYFSTLVGRCKALMKSGDIRYFKLDALATQAKSKGPVNADESNGVLQLATELRKARPNVFVNTAAGAWASPFWCFFADAVGRPDAEFGQTGTAGDARDKWMTYRDSIVHETFVEGAPLCPLNFVAYGPTLVTANGRPGELGNKPADCVKDMRCAFGNGSALQEICVDPELMAQDNGALWDALAECIKWMRRNADVLADTHWVGGKPWDGTDGSVYGWAAWNKKKCTLTLRNSSASEKTLHTTLRQALDVPPNVTGTVTLKNSYADQRALPNLTDQPVDVDAEIDITLQPLEVLVLEGTNAMGK